MRSKKALRNIIFDLLLQFVAIIYGFVVPRIIIGYFGSEVNGLVSSITQFLSYIALFESGFGPVVRATLYKPIADKNRTVVLRILRTAEDFFRRIALIFLVYILVLCFIFPFITQMDFEPLFTAVLILVIGISTFAEYFFGMTYKLYLRAKQETYVISLVQLVTYILCIVAVVLLTTSGANIIIVKAVTGLVFTIRPLALNYYVHRKYNISLQNVKSGYPIKQKWDGLAQHIASVIHSHTDVVVLTLCASLTDVSIYSVYYLVVKGVKDLVLAFTNSIDAPFGDMLAKNEITNLNKKFAAYEVMFCTIATILFTCVIVLITPFVSVYIGSNPDADYYQPLFGVLIVISEYICIIRTPYNKLTYAAGHFKETRTGAWVECILNIVISVILVWNFGIIGVAIGTIVAMAVRAAEFMYHSSRYILNRPIAVCVGKVLLIAAETLVIMLISNFLPFLQNTDFFNLFVNAIIIFAMACLIVIPVNAFVFKNEFRMLIDTVFNIARRRKKDGR